jgi:Spy/CpxP family protein refolding chaperone
MISVDSRRKQEILLIALLLLCLAFVSSSAAQEMPNLGVNCPPNCPHRKLGAEQQAEPMKMPGPQGMGMHPGMGGMMRPGMMGPGRESATMPMERPQNEMRGPDFPGMLRRPEIQKELGITEEQRNKIEEIGFNSSKNAIQQRATLQVLHLELGRLTQADTPDRAAIDKKIQEISQAQSAQMRTMVNLRLDIQSVLTKEQREKIKTLRQNPMGMRMRQMQPGGMRGQPAPARSNPLSTPAPPVQ